MKSNVTIGITDCDKFDNYKNWLEAEPGVSVVRLSADKNNLEDIHQCDGIVLSGGEDVHPKYYNKLEYLSDCHVNNDRDAFEWQVLEQVRKDSLPLLGICRGLQITNVFFGGTLIPDIPKAGKPDHSKFPDKDRYHAVTVKEGSLLSRATATKSGEINSSHHQCADAIGHGLIVNSFSEDGIVEGLERKNPEGFPYLMLVQWHPERMTDPTSVFSKNIKTNFLEGVRANH